VKAEETELIFGNGARSPIVLGLVPLTSLNRSFLWMTELSHSQNVAVPLSTRTNRRLKRSSEAVVRPRGNIPEKSAPAPRTLRKGKTPRKDLRPFYAWTCFHERLRKFRKPWCCVFANGAARHGRQGGFIALLLYPPDLCTGGEPLERLPCLAV